MDQISKVGNIFGDDEQEELPPGQDRGPVGPVTNSDNTLLGPAANPDSVILGPYREPEKTTMKMPWGGGISIPTGQMSEMAEEKRQKETEALGPVMGPDDRILGPYREPEAIKIPGILGKGGATIPIGKMKEAGDPNTGYGEANRDIPGVNTPSNDIEEEAYDPMFRTVEQELEDEKMGIDSFWDSAEERKAKKADYRAWETKDAAEQAEKKAARAEAERKKAEEREALRKIDPEAALKLDRKEAVARAMSNLSRNMGDVELTSDRGGVVSEIGGKVADVIDNPNTAIVKAAEYAQDPGKLGVDAGKAVFGAGETTVGPDGKPRRGPSLFDRGLNEAEAGINNATRSAADTISDIPIVGGMAKPYADLTADMIETQTQIAVGGLKAVGGMAGGMSSMAADLEGTGKMAWKMGENSMLPPTMNPFRLAHAGYDYVTNNENLDLSDVYRRHLDPVNALKERGNQDMAMAEGFLDPYKQSWEQGRYGEMAGRAMVDIGSMFLGGGGGSASKVDAVSDVVRAADTAGDATRVNPYGKTMPATGGPANPYGQTMMDAPAVNPYGKTMPGPGGAPGNPGAPTMVDGPGVNPYGKTMPGTKPSQNVMEMDPLPPGYYPGMPQPPGWRSGPYGSHGPAPVDPLGNTMHGPTFDPPPLNQQIPGPAGQGPVNPYGKTANVGTGRADPMGDTWLDTGRSGVDPFGKTMNRPVDPFGHTGPVPGAPYGKTHPGNSPVSPSAPTLPGAPAVSPHAPTIQVPAQPGISPMAHTMETPLPPMPNSPMANTMTPQYGPYGDTLPVLPGPAHTVPGIGPEVPPTYNIPGMGGGNSVLSSWDALKSIFSF
jgi:hypothetical protein